MDSATTQKILAAVQAKTVETDGKRKITCSDALCLAAELGVAPAEIGALCDDHDIKIRSCQLGCF